MSIIEQVQSIYDEITEYMLLSPSVTEWAEYKVSVGVQERINELLAKNSDGSIALDERTEIEKILTIVDLLNIVKAKAKRQLVDQK